jgi:cytoskeletal protein RodZ
MPSTIRAPGALGILALAILMAACGSTPPNSQVAPPRQATTSTTSHSQTSNAPTTTALPSTTTTTAPPVTTTTVPPTTSTTQDPDNYNEGFDVGLSIHGIGGPSLPLESNAQTACFYWNTNHDNSPGPDSQWTQGCEAGWKVTNG